MNFSTIISELPLTAVADFPINGSGHLKATTPRLGWRKHATNPQNSRSSSSYDPTNQGPSPIIVIKKRSYIFPSSVHEIGRSSNRKWKVTPDFQTLSTSTWRSSRFDFEQYPTAVLPFTMGSTTPTSSDSEVDKHPVKSSDFVFFLPVLLLLGTILVLGIILLCLKRRKKLDEIRHKLLPVYHFAPGEEEEWGVLLNEEEDLFKKQTTKIQKKF